MTAAKLALPRPTSPYLWVGRASLTALFSVACPTSLPFTSKENGESGGGGLRSGVQFYKTLLGKKVGRTGEVGQPSVNIAVNPALPLAQGRANLEGRAQA